MFMLNFLNRSGAGKTYFVFDLIPNFKAKRERSGALAERSERLVKTDLEESSLWSGCAESDRGYKTPSLAYCHYTTAR